MTRQAGTPAGRRVGMSGGLPDRPNRASRWAIDTSVAVAVYDALVGWVARAAGQVLVTRDRRAERVYRALDVPYELVGGT